MKMSKESYDLLKAALDKQAELSPSAVAFLLREHTPRRYRWDRFNALADWPDLSRRFYREGLNDNHIDTALRKALAPRKRCKRCGTFLPHEDAGHAKQCREESLADRY